jgi:hypothetical protein
VTLTTKLDKPFLGGFDCLSQADVIPRKWSNVASAGLAPARAKQYGNYVKFWHGSATPFVGEDINWRSNVAWNDLSGNWLSKNPSPEHKAQLALYLGPYVVSFSPMAEASFKWLRPTIDRVAKLMSLKDPLGRDSAPHAEAIVDALTFFSYALPVDAAPPLLMPLNDGGVQAEWHRGGLDVEVIFSPDSEERGIFVRDKQSGEERELPLDRDVFASEIADRLTTAI